MFSKYPTSYVMNGQDAVVAMKQCVFSELVTNNQAYFAEMVRVQFEVDADDNSVNAYAGHYPDGTPGIVLLQGMLNWASLMAHVVGAVMRGERLSKCIKMLHWISDAVLQPEINTETIRSFEDEFGIVSNGYDCEQQRAIGIAIIRTVLAHESGHICLHHVGYGLNTPTVHRNEERSADLFSVSIFTSGGTCLRDLVAGVMTFVGFQQINLAKDREAKKKKLTKEDKLKQKRLKKIDEGWESHPCNEERIKLFLKSSEAYFKKADITPKMILQLAEL